MDNGKYSCVVLSYRVQFTDSLYLTWAWPMLYELDLINKIGLQVIRGVIYPEYAIQQGKGRDEIDLFFMIPSRCNCL